jgi:hypothetical protein
MVIAALVDMVDTAVESLGDLVALDLEDLMDSVGFGAEMAVGVNTLTSSPVGSKNLYYLTFVSIRDQLTYCV